jgi:hypothetical protein
MLCAAGDGEFPKLAELKQQVDCICELEGHPKDAAKLEEAQKMKDKLLKLFNTPGPASRWHGDLLRKIDGAFEDHFMEDGRPVPCFMLRGDEEYSSRFKKYRDAVVDLCKVESKSRHATGMDVCPSLPSRVYFMLAIPPDVQDPLLIPIPTGNFIKWFDDACKLVPNTFEEVSVIIGSN